MEDLESLPEELTLVGQKLDEMDKEISDQKEMLEELSISFRAIENLHGSAKIFVGETEGDDPLELVRPYDGWLSFKIWTDKISKEVEFILSSEITEDAVLKYDKEEELFTAEGHIEVHPSIKDDVMELAEKHD